MKLKINIDGLINRLTKRWMIQIRGLSGAEFVSENEVKENVEKSIQKFFAVISDLDEVHVSCTNDTSEKVFTFVSSTGKVTEIWMSGNKIASIQSSFDVELSKEEVRSFSDRIYVVNGIKLIGEDYELGRNKKEISKGI